jgi:hypothetical protein
MTLGVEITQETAMTTKHNRRRPAIDGAIQIAANSTGTKVTCAVRAEQRREAFRRFLAMNGITSAALARQIGLSTANAFSNFLRGDTAALSFPTIEAILRAYPNTTFEVLVGLSRPRLNDP